MRLMELEFLLRDTLRSPSITLFWIAYVTLIHWAHFMSLNIVIEMLATYHKTYPLAAAFILTQFRQTELSYVHLFEVCLKICWETRNTQLKLVLESISWFICGMHRLRPVDKWVDFPIDILAITKSDSLIHFELSGETVPVMMRLLFWVRILLEKESSPRGVMGFSSDWPDPGD